MNITSEQRAQLAAYENCFIEYPEITEIYSIFDQNQNTILSTPTSTMITINQCLLRRLKQMPRL